MSVGWQDELLVNDCPLCQEPDFFFPTSDVCVSATLVSFLNTGNFSLYSLVFVQNFCRFTRIFISIKFSSATNVKSTFSSISLETDSSTKLHYKFSLTSGLRLNELWVT